MPETKELSTETLKKIVFLIADHDRAPRGFLIRIQDFSREVLINHLEERFSDLEEANAHRATIEISPLP